jgi:hypothetical protein
MAELGISRGSFDPSYAAQDTGEDITAGLVPPLPHGGIPERAVAPVGFNETTKEVFVNGFTFPANDARRALASERFLDRPPTTLPQGFRPLSPEEFNGYISRITDPSFGRLMSRNFEIGVGNLRELGGRFLQFADPVLGTEATGAAIADAAQEDVARNEPYQRAATDIESAEGAIDWFVSNLAQQGPNLIESALVAIAGVAAGSLGAPSVLLFGAIGALMMRVGGKKGVEAAILAAVKKRVAGQVLDVTEKKLLQEISAAAAASIIKVAGKKEARLGGAAVFTVAGNLAFGVADVTGEQVEAGTRDRAMAAKLAIPYAFFESLPEFIGLGFFARGIKGGLLKRGIKGVAAGAVGEGLTEVGQEALLLTENPEVDAGSPEGIDRLINAFAAGAGVGGAIGGGGAVLRRAPEEEITEKKQVDVNDENEDLLQRELFPGADLGQPPVGAPDLSRGATLFGEAGPEPSSILDRVDADGNVIIGRGVDPARTGTAADRVIDPGGTQLDLFPEATTQSDEDLITKRSALFRRIQELNAKARSGVTITEEEKQESRELADQFKEIQAIFAARGGIQSSFDFTGPTPTAPTTPTEPTIVPTAAPDVVDLVQGDLFTPVPPVPGPIPTEQTDLFGGLPPEEAGFGPVPALAPIQGELPLTGGIDARQGELFGATPTAAEFAQDFASDAVAAQVINNQEAQAQAAQQAAQTQFAAEEAARVQQIDDDYGRAEAQLAAQPLDTPSPLIVPKFINGKEAIFVDGKLVPVASAIEKSNKQTEILDTLHSCLTVEG